MSKFKDNFSSESFYPDSNYYLDQDNTPQERNQFQKTKNPIWGRILNGQTPIGSLLKEQMEGLQ